MFDFVRCLTFAKEVLMKLLISIHLATSKDDDAINNALINAMNQIESTSKLHRSPGDANWNKSSDDAALKKHKSQAVAK